MKRIIIICLLSCLSYTGVAQDSFPFPDSNAVWSYYYQYGHAPGPPMEYDYLTSHFAIFNDDTLINDTLYKKLYETYDSIFPEDLSNNSHSQIRIEGSKVFYRPDYNPVSSISEYLLYDFSMDVDDTINILVAYGDSYTLICQDIDSILLDGNYRKRWLITCPETNFYNYWIEGIGSDYRFLASYEPYFSVDFDFFKLLCFEREGSLVYEDTLNPDYESNCHTEGHWPPWGIEETKKEQARVLVAPNPVVGKSLLKFEHVEGNLTEVYIYSATGQLLKTYRSGNQELVIYNKNYEKGIYFIKAIAGSRVFTTKFIIH